MLVGDDVEFNFLEKVPSDQRVLNPLGLTDHLGLQDDFVPGITSVTDRIRYYTLLAWYYENLYEERIVDSRDFERIFILACTAHHDGDTSHPDLQYVFNRTRFTDDYDERDKFGLDFDITGNGTGYYVAQLRRFKCAWTDQLGQTRYTKLNERLANTLDIPLEPYEKDEFTKDYLKQNLSNLCICNESAEEIEIMSKIFFGFFSKQDGEWDLDNDEFNEFEEGNIELDFNPEYLTGTGSDEEITRQRNLRRRNTLFLFLKILNETEVEDVRRSIWDGVYFSQARGSGEDINFGDLEKARKYWEYFQLNLYYVYSIENLLDVLQRLIRKNNGIEEEELLEELDDEEVQNHLSSYLEAECSTLQDIFSAVEELIGGRETDLETRVNESNLYDRISNAGDWREKVVMSLLLLLTLKFKFDRVSEDVKKYGGTDPDSSLIQDSLNIESMYDEISESQDREWVEFLQELVRRVKQRHVFEASTRLRDNETRSWIFTEEEGRLFFSRQKPVSFGPRDNRWDSIEHLLTDLNFVEEEDGETILTEKGEQWIQRIQ